MGYDDDEIRRRVKAGTLQQLFRGVHSSADPDTPGTEEPLLLLARAVARGHIGTTWDH